MHWTWSLQRGPRKEGYARFRSSGDSFYFVVFSVSINWSHSLVQQPLLKIEEMRAATEKDYKELTAKHA